LHAYENVPFYSRRLERADVIKDNNNVNLYEFGRLPLLTREDIRNHINELVPKDLGRMKWHYDSSSGTTGDPIRFIRDKLDNKWRRATERYYYEDIIGIDELSVKKIVIWGSAKEVYAGTIGARAKIINWLTNTSFCNSYKMNVEDMERYVKKINSHKPDLIRGFAGSLYDLCNFVEKKRIPIHQPKVVISTAELLQKGMREKIEQVFETKVYNFYGTRETNGVVGECEAGLLHIFLFNNLVEVLDKQNRPVKEGELGKLVVTTLHNYSMPLIRYEIGDMGILGPKTCRCGNPLPTLEEVTGRQFEYFIKEDGQVIHGAYFIYLLKINGWIKDLQIIQEDYLRIKFVIVLQNKINEAEKRDIENKTKLVMGKNCKIFWEFVDMIPKPKSGKYLAARSLLQY